MFKHNLTAVLNLQRPDAKGLFPVRIRQTIQRKVTYHPTGIMLTKDQLIKGEVVKHPNKALQNSTIRIKINEIEKRLLEASILGEDLAKIKKNTNIGFYDYASNKLEKSKGLLAKGTYLHKKSYLKKVVTFRPHLKLKDVNKDCVTDLETYCRSIGNRENTVWSTTKYLKTVISEAVQDGTLIINPLKGFKGAKYIDPLREVLTANEVLSLEAFADNPLNNPRLTHVASWFVLSCYTGLRYADLVTFKGLVNGKVLLQTHKTSSIVSIFATDQIIRSIARLNKPIYSNQKCNEYIKATLAILGIDKKISFHSARHSFSVNFLNNGGRIEILSKILGHSTLKTTQIYAKISTILADDEMKRVWQK